MTKDDLDRIRQDYYAGIVRREDTFSSWLALEQAWAERDGALAELQRMKNRPCEQEFSRLDRMWNSLVAEREALKAKVEELVEKGGSNLTLSIIPSPEAIRHEIVLSVVKTGGRLLVGLVAIHELRP